MKIICPICHQDLTRAYILLGKRVAEVHQVAHMAAAVKELEELALMVQEGYSRETLITSSKHALRALEEGRSITYESMRTETGEV